MREPGPQQALLARVGSSPGRPILKRSRLLETLGGGGWRRWWWRRRPMTEDLFVAGAKTLAIVANGGRRYWRPAEARMMSDVRRQSLADVAPCRFHTVMVALLRELSCRRRRRRIIRGRMRTSGKDKRQQQHCQCERFPQEISSVLGFQTPGKSSAVYGRTPSLAESVARTQSSSQLPVPSCRQELTTED